MAMMSRRGAREAVILTPNQSRELASFVVRHNDEERIAADFGERPRPIVAVEPFQCDVPGMLAVKSHDDDTLTLLYPEPRPVPRDPLFQHAGDVSRFHEYLLAWSTRGRQGFYRDWQWPNVLMDAPQTMPAGSCESFSADSEAYGAMQTTCDRPGAWE